MFIHFRDREIEIDMGLLRKRNSHPLVHSSTAYNDLDWAEIQELRTQSRSPTWVGSTQLLEPLPLIPGSAINRNLELGTGTRS